MTISSINMHYFQYMNGPVLKIDILSDLDSTLLSIQYKTKTVIHLLELFHYLKIRSA